MVMLAVFTARPSASSHGLVPLTIGFAILGLLLLLLLPLLTAGLYLRRRRRRRSKDDDHEELDCSSSTVTTESGVDSVNNNNNVDDVAARSPSSAPTGFITARCNIVQSAVLRLHVVCLSVCLSAVCNVGRS